MKYGRCGFLTLRIHGSQKCRRNIISNLAKYLFLVNMQNVINKNLKRFFENRDRQGRLFTDR